MRRKTAARLAMAGFLTACLIPSVTMPFAPTARAARQTLARPPKMTTAEGRFNFDVLQDTADWLSDHLAFRETWITADARLNAALFRASTADLVTVGRGDWLFYRADLADYLRTAPMTDRELFRAAHTLSLVRDWAAERGAAFYVTVAPNKAGLYPDRIPSVGTPLPGADDAARFAAALEREGVGYIDLFTPFREAGEVLYFHADSHWTTRGAALAHDAIVTAVGQECARFCSGGWREGMPHAGDLAGMLYPAGAATEPDMEPDRELSFTYVSAYTGPEDHIIDTACPGRTGSLLLFRDSFGNSLFPFLADSFGTARFSRAMPLQLDQWEGEETVVLEIVERNLDYLTRKAPVFPAPERTAAEIPRNVLPEGNGLRVSPDGNGFPAADAAPVPEGSLSAALRAVQDGSLSGYVRIEGNLSAEPDTNSPIYVVLGGRVYEASPAGEGVAPFTLYVDAARADGGAEVWYDQDGTLFRAAFVTRED